MVMHWYNEILMISHYLGIAILESECVATAATTCPPLLDGWALMFRQVRNLRIAKVCLARVHVCKVPKPDFRENTRALQKYARFAYTYAKFRKHDFTLISRESGDIVKVCSVRVHICKVPCCCCCCSSQRSLKDSQRSHQGVTFCSFFPPPLGSQPPEPLVFPARKLAAPF